ncbi:glycoside hydrolase [Herbiconiux sp. L3-i23]|nr:glycoside hydrolase [Herbiconiux sp. L3-i23]
MMLVAAAAAVVCLGVAGCSFEPERSAAVDVDLPEPFALDADFADPDILSTTEGMIAYATQSEDAHVQVATSPDGQRWTLTDTDAMPVLPDWVRAGDTWAPDVVAWEGGHLLFHTSTDDASGVQCIGVARSRSALGPFVEVGEAPLVCPTGVGAIDASFFVDVDGSAHLLWKVDANCCGGTGEIWIAPLDHSGTRLEGPATLLLSADTPGEGRVVEAPTLVWRDGRYVLLHSAGDYYTLEYSIRWASSSALLGPYVKAPQPLLSTESSDFAYIGPGGQDVTDDRIFFHSWDAGHGYRGMSSLALTWDGYRPQVVLERAPD